MFVACANTVVVGLLYIACTDVAKAASPPVYRALNSLQTIVPMQSAVVCSAVSFQQSLFLQRSFLLQHCHVACWLMGVFLGHATPACALCHSDSVAWVKLLLLVFYGTCNLVGPLLFITVCLWPSISPLWSVSFCYCLAPVLFPACAGVGLCSVC